jgi:hypothetical protein
MGFLGRLAILEAPDQQLAVAIVHGVISAPLTCAL